MAAGDNMNSDPLNTTSNYPVSATASGSDFNTLLILLQILLRTKKFHQKPEQELQLTSNITWSQNNFTTGSNLQEFKATHTENNDVSKIIKNNETRESPAANEHILRKRHAGKDNKNTLEQMAKLYTELGKRYLTITSLKKELETCRNGRNQDQHSEIDALNAEIREQETDIKDLTERIARLEMTVQEYQKQNSNLKFKNKRQGKEIQDLRKELEEMKNEEETSCHSIRNLQPLSVTHSVGNWHKVMLNDSFGPGSKLVIRGKAGMNVSRMEFNLHSSEAIALHIDNRWDYHNYGHRMVLNTYQNYKWGPEVTIQPEPINKGARFVVSIQSLEKQFEICINNVIVANYTHRFPPSLINVFIIENAEEISSIYYHGHI